MLTENVREWLEGCLGREHGHELWLWVFRQRSKKLFKINKKLCSTSTDINKNKKLMILFVIFVKYKKLCVRELKKLMNFTVPKLSI